MRAYVLILTLGLLPGTLLADAMLCANGIIDTGSENGPYKKDVREKCGAPSEDQGTIWRYERDAFYYVLTFEDDGELMDIDQEPKD